jgi:SAM-dependent methyltransferase
MIYRALRIYDPQGAIGLVFQRSSYLETSVKDKSVLHIGCSDYPLTEEKILNHQLLHANLQHAASRIIGIDLSHEGVALMRKHGFSDIKVMDAEDIHIDDKYDVILAGDVLEHMNNPGKFLEIAHNLLLPHGELIIGVPSAMTANNIKAWFCGREVVHCDHTFYFSPKTLATLCARYNLLPTRLVFTVQPQSQYETMAFVLFRKLLLRCFYRMAPSFIMHFKWTESIDQSKFIEWK